MNKPTQYRRRCVLKITGKEEVIVPRAMCKQCGWKSNDIIKLDVLSMGLDMTIQLTREVEE